MNNEVSEEKNWMRHNWKWFVPSLVIVVILAMLLVATGSVGGASDLAAAYKDEALYENAVKQSNENNKVIEILGTLEPVDNMAILEGTVKYSDDKQSVNLTVRVKGDKGKAKMDVVASKMGSIWQYNLIKIRVKASEQEIIVLQ